VVSLSEAVARHHAERPGQAGLPLSAARAVVGSSLRPWITLPRDEPDGLCEQVIEAAVSGGHLVDDGDVLRVPGFEVAVSDPGLAESTDRLVELLDTVRPAPLSKAAREARCPVAALPGMERSGRIVVVADDLAWSAATFGRLRDLALSLAADAPLTPAALRDATGTSRKYVMALLEELDRRGILVRTPAGHVRGPRA
jgi:selenocysteine-specific elongation factor